MTIYLLLYIMTLMCTWILQYDYTKGQLPELIDVIIEEKAKLFVCAIGVPPKWAVEKLHKAGIPVMNVRLTVFNYILQ